MGIIFYRRHYKRANVVKVKDEKDENLVSVDENELSMVSKEEEDVEATSKKKEELLWNDFF